MSERRPAAVGGLAFAVLSIAALVTMPPPPDADASSATLRHYFLAHSTAIRSGSAVAAVAALSLLPFFATLRRHLASTAGDAVFAAGAVTVTVGVVGSALQAGLANAQPRLGNDGLLTFFAVERVVFYVGPALAVTMIGAAAVVAFRASMPAWLTAVSAVLGVVAAIGGIATLISDSKAAGGIGLGGFLLTIVWSGATAIVLLRQPATAAATR